MGQVQADELWVKLVGRKLWMAMAIAVPSRLWLGGAVGQRDKGLIRAIATMVRSCASSARVLVFTDGLSSYAGAFARAWRKSVRTGRVGRP